MNKKAKNVIAAAVLFSIAVITVCAVKSSYDTQIEIRESKEQNIPGRSIVVDNSKIHTQVDIVEIDGVEYLIASTTRGVSICRK